jgi:hypothetical protein
MPRQWRRERVRLLARGPAAVRVEVGGGERHVERANQERAREIDRLRAIALAQRVVQEAVQDVTLLDRRAEPVEERVLRRMVDDPVGAGDQSWVGTVIAAASATTRSAASCSPSSTLTEMRFDKAGRCRSSRCGRGSRVRKRAFT